MDILRDRDQAPEALLEALTFRRADGTEISLLYKEKPLPHRQGLRILSIGREGPNGMGGYTANLNLM